MSVIEPLLAEVRDLTKKMKEAKANLVEKIKPQFHDIFKPFLEKYPEVKELRFTAYTPYFNDGEPCEYSVGELHGFYNTEDECEYDGSLPVCGPSPSELAEFKRTGEVTGKLRVYVEHYTKPSNKYNHTTRSYEKLPAKYETLADAARAVYREQLMLDLEELEAKGKLIDDFTEISSVLSSIPDDVIYEMFGDHVKIVITREGVEVEEYSHD